MGPPRAGGLCCGRGGRPGTRPQLGMDSSGKAAETSSTVMPSTMELSECRLWVSVGSAVSRWSAGRGQGVSGQFMGWGLGSQDSQPSRLRSCCGLSRSPTGHVVPKVRSGHGSEAAVQAAVGGVGPRLPFTGPVRGSDSAVPRGHWDRGSLLPWEVSASRAGGGRQQEAGPLCWSRLQEAQAPPPRPQSAGPWRGHGEETGAGDSRGVRAEGAGVGPHLPPGLGPKSSVLLHSGLQEALGTCKRRRGGQGASGGAPRGWWAGAPRGHWEEAVAQAAPAGTWDSRPQSPCFLACPGLRAPGSWPGLGSRASQVGPSPGTVVTVTPRGRRWLGPFRALRPAPHTPRGLCPVWKGHGGRGHSPPRGGRAGRAPPG